MNDSHQAVTARRESPRRRAGQCHLDRRDLETVLGMSRGLSAAAIDLSLPDHRKRREVLEYLQPS